MKKPLVSVICLCHNHGKHVEHAIFSVLNQKYDNVELIVVDDASADASREIIPKLSKKYGLKLSENSINTTIRRLYAKNLLTNPIRFKYALPDRIFQEYILKIRGYDGEGNQ